MKQISLLIVLLVGNSCLAQQFVSIGPVKKVGILYLVDLYQTNLNKINYNQQDYENTIPSGENYNLNPVHKLLFGVDFHKNIDDTNFATKYELEKRIPESHKLAQRQKRSPTKCYKCGGGGGGGGYQPGYGGGGGGGGRGGGSSGSWSQASASSSSGSWGGGYGKGK